MRHRIKGRKLGRNGPHRKALFRNLCRAIVLTCESSESGLSSSPGRIRTTLEKAKELRPFLERLVTIAVKAKLRSNEASKLISSYARETPEWKQWRSTKEGQSWLNAQSRYIHLQRALFSVLRSRYIVKLLIDGVAPKFVGRPGGYTRVVRIAKPRLADGARLAFLEFVGQTTKLAVEK